MQLDTHTKSTNIPKLRTTPVAYINSELRLQYSSCEWIEVCPLSNLPCRLCPAGENSLRMGHSDAIAFWEHATIDIEKYRISLLLGEYNDKYDC